MRGIDRPFALKTDHRYHLSMGAAGGTIFTMLLAIAYYAVITPVGLIVRLVHDPLRRRWDARAASYWDELRPPGVEQPHWL